MARLYYVYILASGRNGTLYIGVTNNLRRRIEEHRSENPKAFTSRYKVNQLVHVETFNNVRLALQREKRLKKWKRSWKLELIEKDNPTWRDLSKDLH